MWAGGVVASHERGSGVVLLCTYDFFLGTDRHRKAIRLLQAKEAKEPQVHQSAHIFACIRVF